MCCLTVAVGYIGGVFGVVDGWRRCLVVGRLGTSGCEVVVGYGDGGVVVKIGLIVLVINKGGRDSSFGKGVWVEVGG